MFGRFFAVPIPKRPPVPPNKTRICVAGYGISHNTGRAQKLAAQIAATYSDRYETWFCFSTLQYKEHLSVFLAEIPKDQKSLPSTFDANAPPMEKHRSSPYVWLERSSSSSSSSDKHPALQALGGRDKFCDWAKSEFPNDEEVLTSLTSLEDPPIAELFFDNSTPGGTWMDESAEK